MSMNILYIHTHDSGRFFEPYGYPVRTPSMMKLARESVMFRQCFSAAPTCSPSRSALLTGLPPHTAGMLGLAHRGFSLKDPALHITSLLKDAGWKTVLSGIQHEAFRSSELRYDRILTEHPIEMDAFHSIDGKSYDLENARRVAEFLKSKDSSKSPFFLSFGLFNTHREFPLPRDPDASHYILPPPHSPDTPAVRQDMLSFHESVQVVDRCVEMVLEALLESGRDRDTIVLFTTDHGIPFPRHKCTLYDGGIGVACLLKVPSLQGKVCDSLVSHLDILPTLLDLVELPKPSYLTGRSLLPLLRGDTEEVRDSIFAEITYHAAYEPVRCIRTGRYKYIRRFQEDRTTPVPSNIDDCPSKDLWIEAGYLSEPVTHEELYDLLRDPLETRNLSEDPRYQEVREDLRFRLETWMRETQDPLLAGPVPLPPGAFANKQSCLSPSEEDFERGE